MAKCYEIQPEDRLFPYTKSFLNHEMLRGCKKSGVKKIRVHDLRHSYHASLLIEALSKDLDAVKQSILDDSKIVKKGISGISVKIYPENE